MALTDPTAPGMGARATLVHAYIYEAGPLVGLAGVRAGARISVETLQIAAALVSTWFNPSTPVLWRPVVDFASSTEQVIIRLRSDEGRIAPASVTIYTKQITLEFNEQTTTIERKGSAHDLVRDARVIDQQLQDLVHTTRFGRRDRDADKAVELLFKNRLH